MVSQFDETMSDDELESRLRLSLRSLPADLLPGDSKPPESLIAGARWIHDWHNMDAELAAITFDSWSEASVTVRSSGSLRELTLEVGRYTIELEIEPDGARSADLSGLISPAVDGTLRLLSGGREVTVSIEAGGSFVAERVPAGTVLAYVETPEATFRLPAFEI